MKILVVVIEVAVVVAAKALVVIIYETELVSMGFWLRKYNGFVCASFSSRAFIDFH